MKKAWIILICYFIVIIPVFYVMIVLAAAGNALAALLAPAIVVSAVRVGIKLDAVQKEEKDNG